MGNELGNELLPTNIHNRLLNEAQQGARKEIGITTDEALKFEEAATGVKIKELPDDIPDVAETLAGIKVKVSRSGWIFTCSSPCDMLRERYKDLLALQDNNFLKRLNTLEESARGLPPGARQQIADEAAALERDMQRVPCCMAAERRGAIIKTVSPTGSKVISDAPTDWQIVLIDPKNPPDIVPDGVVLEFPTGERVWRTEGTRQRNCY